MTVRPAPDKGAGPANEDSPRKAALPESNPIAAAIVVSRRGVLVARRNDGKPPWMFIAGEIEPGEDPAAAAVREVKEETGLRIRGGHSHGSWRLSRERSRLDLSRSGWPPVQGTRTAVGGF